MNTTLRLLSLPFRWLWKFISTGISVLSNLLFLGFTLFILTLVLYTPEVRVPDHSALLFAPKGSIVEKRSPMDPITHAINDLAGIPIDGEILLQDILDGIRAAAGDQRIRMLVITADHLEAASMDQIRAIGSAIDHFKESGKKVVAYGDSFSQLQYYLAAWADQVFLHPMGAVNLRGFGVYRLYLQELLDKMDINVHVFRVGSYKSALEPFLRTSMSPEDREANMLWLGNLWSAYCTDIANHRKTTVAALNEQINTLVTNLQAVDGDRGQLALASGLIDGLKTRQEMETFLREQVGTSPDAKSFSHIGFQHYLRTVDRSHTDPGESNELIGIITATGNIMYGEGTVNQIGSAPLLLQIRKAREDKRIKALVLRISTGGGSAFASELIRQELALTRQEGKPVVVSMGAMAASGGYWLAADADAIVASPTTLTGSIGIFGAVPTVEKALAHFGVRADGVGTTAIAHFGNPTTAMSSEEAKTFQMEVEQGYRRFIALVAAGRKMAMQEVEKVAEGRVWDGGTAHRLGLVDKLGGLDEAIAEAARLTGVAAEKTIYVDLGSTDLLEMVKRMDKPVETLVRRISETLPGAQTLARELAPHIEYLLGSPDPARMYAHSLLPPQEVLFR